MSKKKKEKQIKKEKEKNEMTTWAIVASLGSSTANAFRRSRCDCTTIA